jgi:hypothetical protein
MRDPDAIICDSQLSENLAYHFSYLARYGRGGGQSWRLYPDKVNHLWHPGIAFDHKVGHAMLIRRHEFGPQAGVRELQITVGNFGH